MQVSNPRILLALSACFAAALAGVGFVYINALGALLFATIALVASYSTLNLAWNNRDNIEALNKHAESMAMTGMILFLPSILVWGLLPALLILLAFAQLALNLQLVEHKHVHYGLLVSFICLFMGAAEAVTGYYLVFIACYASAAAICLSMLNADRPGSTPAPIRPVPGLGLLAWLLGATVIVYLVMPRPPAANLGSQYSVAAHYYKETEWPKESDSREAGDRGNNETTAASGGANVPSSHDSSAYSYQGFDEQFSILDNGQTSSTGNALLALMSAAHGAYLKVESFDRFDGLSWHKNLHYQDRLKLDDLTLELEAGQEANFQHTITLINDLGRYIPAAPVAVKLYFPADSIERDAYQNLKLPGRLQKNIVYTVESHVSYQQQRLFSGTKVPPTQSDLSLYDDFDRRIARLAAEVTQGASDDMGKALLLESYLKHNYQYDVDSIFTSQQRTPLNQFLFETKAGHCEFFASALAVMLRSQGIPSRLITGFSATTLNPLTGYYEIYALDGHAWVEAWIDGKGWMLLEATPPYDLPGPTTEIMTARLLQNYVEKLGKYAALGHNDTPTLAEIWSFLAAQLRALIAFLGELIARYFVVLMLLTVSLLAVWLLYRHYRNDILAWQLHRRVNGYRHSNTAADAIFYMRQIHRLLQLRDQPRLPGDSIEALCQHTALQGLDAAARDALSNQINQRFYEDIKQKLNAELFKDVFYHIYNHTSDRGIGNS